MELFLAEAVILMIITETPLGKRLLIIPLGLREKLRRPVSLNARCYQMSAIVGAK